MRLLVDWANPADVQSIRGYLSIPTIDENSYQGPPGYQNITQNINYGLGANYMGVPVTQPQQQQQQQQTLGHQYSLPQPQNNMQTGNTGSHTHDKDEVNKYTILLMKMNIFLFF